MNTTTQNPEEEKKPEPHEVIRCVSLHSLKGDFTITISAPNYDKLNEMYLASQVSHLSPEERVSPVTIRMLKLRHFIDGFTHDQCLAFLGYPDKPRKKGKKQK